MMGRRPEPVPGVEPGRWRVYKMRGLPETVRPGWYVQRENCGGGVSFPTWREAQDYADQQARTREIVLPRIAPKGEVTVSAMWGYGEPVVYYIDASGKTVQGTPADLARHAATLLALAEQEESCER